MNIKHRIGFELSLVISTIIVFIYNFYNQRKIVYMASIIAVVGTIFNLIRDIIKVKKE